MVTVPALPHYTVVYACGCIKAACACIRRGGQRINQPRHHRTPSHIRNVTARLNERCPQCQADA